MALEAGQWLLHYRLIEKIGEGGMGIVWRAEDSRLRRQVALKVLPEAMASDRERRARFEREARAVAALSHPNIVTLYSVEDAETPNGPVHFTTMELVEGSTLTRLIPEGGLPWDALPAIAIPLVDAVCGAHRAGITHRDLKPDNIMVDAEGRLRVLDFGLAKLGGPVEWIGDRESSAATTEGQLLGTVAYMSPEQAAGKPVDTRSDIFSLGTILYELATGARPFRGDSAVATIGAILRDEPVPILELKSSLPAGLTRVVGRCLRKDAGERYQHADELLEALRALERAPGGPMQGRARHAGRWVAAVLAGLAVALLGYALLTSDTDAGSGASDPESVSAGEELGSRPSIGVVAFADAGSRPDQEYFGTGLTEDITTELSRYPELFVVASASARATEEATRDVLEIGAALGVRYILHGSIRRLDDRLRVTAQLTDVRNGQLLWGHTYEPSLTAGDLFDLQDELAQQVVNALVGSAGVLSRSGLSDARRKAPRNLDSYDCVLLTYEYLHSHIEEQHLRARDALEIALQSEADYASGWAWLAYLYLEEFHHGYNERPDPPAPLTRALEAADRAIRLDSGNQVAHGVQAAILLLQGDLERGKVAARKSISLNPNSGMWLALVGTWLVSAGEFDQGMPLARRAVELNPNPAPWLRMPFFLERYHGGDYEAALAEALVVDTEDHRTPLFRAASYAQLGRTSEAERAAAEWRAQWTGPLDGVWDNMVRRNGFAPELVERLLEGLRKAGVDVPSPKAGS